MTGASPIGRVLQVHTRYRQRGGEDAVVDAERRLLESGGVRVEQIIFDNADLRESQSIAGDARLAVSAIWSRRAARRLAGAIAVHRPDIVHVHNTFSAASPSVYAAAARAGVPVVQTLHNYRFVCPSATAFRDGRPCTDCVGRVVPWPGVAHACVRGSHAQSLAVAATMTFHRVRRTYRAIRAYIALTEFQRDLMIAGGMPPGRIRVVPNFLEADPGAGDGRRDGFLFVGRLSAEKGIDALVRAAETLPGAITIVGDGPLAAPVERAKANGDLEWLGALDRAPVLERVRSAEALLVPSVWFEGFPLVILEAFASATPVIASRIGSLAELVDDGVNGLLVKPGRSDDLRTAIWRMREDPAGTRRMGAVARETFDRRFTPGIHLEALIQTYDFALQSTMVGGGPRALSGRS